MRILVVEDEVMLRELYAEYLSIADESYDVTIVEDGSQALNELNSVQKGYDLIITDLVMPKVDGTNMVKEIRKTNNDIKIIVVSAVTDPFVKEKLIEQYSVYRYFMKPFSITDVFEVIEEI